MRVACVSGFAAYWDRYPVDILDRVEGQTVGGGEENFLQCTVGLASLGHDVEAWHCGEAGVWRGVKFNDSAAPLFNRLVEEHWDVVAAWSTLRPLEWAPKGARRLYIQQLNDLIEPGEWSKVDCVVSPSYNHTLQLPNWGWREKHCAVVHNGLDSKEYGEVDGVARTHQGPRQIKPWRERGLNVGYWSSPDRGLHHLLKAWPAVLHAVPGAKLHIFYELDRLLANAQGCPGPLGDRIRLLASLLPAAKADSSITFHGQVPRHKLRATQIECRVMCYPLVPISWTEGFCGSVNQGIAAGCHVLATPQDALPSLYNGAITWLPLGPENINRELSEYLVKALTDEAWSEAQVAKARPHRFNFTWERAAKEFEKACAGEDWTLTGKGDNEALFIYEAR